MSRARGLPAESRRGAVSVPGLWVLWELVMAPAHRPLSELSPAYPGGEGLSAPRAWAWPVDLAGGWARITVAAQPVDVLGDAGRAQGRRRPRAHGRAPPV